MEKVKQAIAANQPVPATQATQTPRLTLNSGARPASAAVPRARASAPEVPQRAHLTREELRSLIKEHSDFSDILKKYPAAADGKVKEFALMAAASLGRNPHLATKVKREHFENLIKLAAKMDRQNSTA